MSRNMQLESKNESVSFGAELLVYGGEREREREREGQGEVEKTSD
jgi:hypothetical protein